MIQLPHKILNFKHCKFNIVSLLIIAAIVRLILLIVLQPWSADTVTNTFYQDFDSRQYYKLAINIINEKSFISFVPFRTPGYPVFLSFIFLVFGIRPWLILLVHILINLFSIYLIYYITRSIFSVRIALIASAIFAFEPHTLYYCYILLPETLFVFSLIVTLLLVLKVIHSNRWIHYLLLGISLSIVAYIKPIGIYLPIVIGFSLLLFYKKHKLIFLRIIGSFFLYILLLTPWYIRNYSIYNEIGFCTIQGFNLYLYNVCITEAYKSGKNVSEIKESFRAEYKNYKEKHNNNPFTTSKHYGNYSRKYLLNNLKYYIPLHIKGMRNILITQNKIEILRYFKISTHPSGKQRKADNIPEFSVLPFENIIILTQRLFAKRPLSEHILGMYILLFSLSVYFGFIYGIYKMTLLQKHFILLLFLCIIIYFLGIVGIAGHARYKLPVIPFITIISSVGWNLIFSKRQPIEDEQF